MPRFPPLVQPPMVTLAISVLCDVKSRLVVADCLYREPSLVI